LSIPHPKSKSKMFQNQKLFECQHKATSGKFHTCLHMMVQSQNTASLKKKKYIIIFRLCL
jgi:hypothetical protein